MVQPHELFEIWSPDEVAECMSGVTPDEYEVLWSLVGEVAERGETPDTCFGRALVHVWDRVPAAMQSHLNELAEVTLPTTDTDLC
jgi:hypothetical protein